MKNIYTTIVLFSLLHIVSLTAQDSIFIDDQNMIAVEILSKTYDEISFRELGKEDSFTLAINKIAHTFETDKYSIYYMASQAATDHHISKLNPGIGIAHDLTSADSNMLAKLSGADQIKAEKKRIRQQILQAIKTSRIQQNRIVLITNQGKIKGRMIDISEDEVIVVSGRSIEDYHKISYKDIEKLQIRIMGKNRYVPGLVAASFGGIFTYYALKITIEGDQPSSGFQPTYLTNYLSQVIIAGSYVLGSKSASRKYHFNISHAQSAFSDFVEQMEKAALK